MTPATPPRRDKAPRNPREQLLGLRALRFIAAMLGGSERKMIYKDAAAAPAKIATPTGAVMAVTLALAALVLSSRLFTLLTEPDPWFDEAMLILNFFQVSWGDLLAPLPYFEQATSLGHLAIGLSIAHLLPESAILLLRCVSAFASLATGVLLYILVRRASDPLEAAMVSALAMCAPSVIFQSIEIKSYALDLFSTAAVLLAASHCNNTNVGYGAVATFIATGVIALILSNTAIFVICGSIAALLVCSFTEYRLDNRRIARISIAASILGAAAIGLYIMYTRPGTSLQISAYAAEMAAGKLPIPFATSNWLGDWLEFAGLLTEPFFHGSAAIPLALAVVGASSTLASKSSSTRFLGAASGALLATLAMAAMAGIYTPVADRHVLFAVPAMAFFIVRGLFLAARSMRRLRIAPFQKIAEPLAVCVIFVYCLWSVNGGLDTRREPIRPELEHLTSRKDWPAVTWVYYGAQPAVDVLTYPRRIAYLGRVSYASSPTGWLGDVRRNYDAYLDRFRGQVSGRHELYILTAHGSGDEVRRLIKTAELSVGPCRIVSSEQGSRGDTRLLHCQRVSTSPAGPIPGHATGA